MIINVELNSMKDGKLVDIFQEEFKKQWSTDGFPSGIKLKIRDKEIPLLFDKEIFINEDAHGIKKAQFRIHSTE